MSLWKRIACTPEYEQRMKRYYDDKGLADLREYLAQWLEDRIMSERINSSDLFEPIAHKFYEDLKQKLITLSNDNLIKYKLAEICKHVTQLTAVDLYAYFRNGLQTEIQMLEDMPHNAYMFGNGSASGIGGVGGNGINGRMDMNGAFGGNLGNLGGAVGGVGVGLGVGSGVGVGVGVGVAGMMQTDELYIANGRIQKLRNDFERFRQAVLQLHSEYDTFSAYYATYNQNKPVMDPDVIRESDLRIQSQITALIGRKKALIVELRNILTENDSIQNGVINTLNNWRRNQALAGNGAHYRDNLDEIQTCMELILDTATNIISNGDILLKIQVDDNEDLNRLLTHVHSMREMLVLSAFIVERQPPQVMKTNTRFAASVRWLIGPQLGLGNDRNTPQVECIILSEAQAQRHSAQRSCVDGPGSGASPSSGDLSNCTSNMEYQPQSRVFSASFRNMQLKKIKRAEKKGTESVMDEKFALLFQTTATVNDYRIRVWTLSLPVVVIVHGNQEPQSWATITWDNAFADIVREPFQVPDKVSWSQLSVALNTKFASTTGRHLTDENLNFLYEKLFRHEGMTDDQKDYITWAQFCKETLPDRSFTFWEWFFAIMKLTKDHLLNLWKAGLIVGFISKNKTIDETLRNMPAGTFLLRFSDSESGGITVALVNDVGKVLMLTPWTARDLSVLSLADRIRDLSCLYYLYPLNKPKDEAFGEFYAHRVEEQPTRDGYVANTIRAHVPAIEGGSLNNTPHHQMQSPNPLATENFDFDSILYSSM